MFSIGTSRALFKYLAIPSVGIPPIPSNKNFKIKDHDLEDDARCGYDSDNECGHFLNAIKC